MQGNDGEMVDGLAPSTAVTCLSHPAEYPNIPRATAWWVGLKAKVIELDELEDAPEYARSHPDHMVIA